MLRQQPRLQRDAEERQDCGTHLGDQGPPVLPPANQQAAAPITSKENDQSTPIWSHENPKVPSKLFEGLDLSCSLRQREELFAAPEDAPLVVHSARAHASPDSGPGVAPQMAQRPGLQGGYANRERRTRGAPCKGPVLRPAVHDSRWGRGVESDIDRERRLLREKAAAYAKECREKARLVSDRISCIKLVVQLHLLMTPLCSIHPGGRGGGKACAGKRKASSGQPLLVASPCRFARRPGSSISEPAATFA